MADLIRRTSKSLPATTKGDSLAASEVRRLNASRPLHSALESHPPSSSIFGNSYNVKNLKTLRNSGHSEVETQEREHFDDKQVQSIFADVCGHEAKQTGDVLARSSLGTHAARLEEVAQLNLKTDLRSTLSSGWLLH